MIFFGSFSEEIEKQAFNLEHAKERLKGPVADTKSRVKSGIKYGLGEAALISTLPLAFGAKAGIVAKHMAEHGRSFGQAARKLGTAAKANPIATEYIGSKLDKLQREVKGMSTARAAWEGAKAPYKAGFLKPAESLSVMGLVGAPGFAKGFIVGGGQKKK